MRSASSAPPTPSREAGVVVDPLRDAGLTAQGALLDDEGVDPLAGGVDGGGQAGGPTADDHEVVEGPLRLQREAQFAGELAVGRLGQQGAVGENNGGDNLLAVVLLTHELGCGGVLVDVDPIVGDAHLAQELLGAAAVGAPGRAVDLDHLLAHGFLLQGVANRRLPIPYGGIRPGSAGGLASVAT